MVQRPGLPTRRGLVTTAVAIGIAVSAGGCSVIAKSQSAAIVNGQQITVSEVAEATKQYNEFVVPQQSGTAALTEARTVGTLVLASFIIDYVDSTGRWKPDATYNNLLSTVPGASPTTIELLKFNSITGQGGPLTQADVTAILAVMAKAKVEVDPRYGTFDATTGGFKDRNLDWIKPVPASQNPEPAPSAQ